jgi:L-glyceraldehyde 3-phosphate reductase
MFDRWVEKVSQPGGESLLDVLDKSGIGCIVFSPLAQGLLTDKYLNNIPPSSRVGRGLANGALQRQDINEKVLKKISKLNEMAAGRNQSLAQMALAWILKDHRITSVLIGASTTTQLTSNLDCLLNISFEKEEVLEIESVLLGE